MWALVESNNVTQVYTRPKALTIGDVNYPSNIFMLWSASELEAIGIYEIVIDNSNLKDKEFCCLFRKFLRVYFQYHQNCLTHLIQLRIPTS